MSPLEKRRAFFRERERSKDRTRLWADIGASERRRWGAPPPWRPIIVQTGGQIMAYRATLHCGDPR